MPEYGENIYYISTQFTTQFDMLIKSTEMMHILMIPAFKYDKCNVYLWTEKCAFHSHAVKSVQKYSCEKISPEI